MRRDERPLQHEAVGDDHLEAWMSTAISLFLLFPSLICLFELYWYSRKVVLWPTVLPSWLVSHCLWKRLNDVFKHYKHSGAVVAQLSMVPADNPKKLHHLPAAA